MKVYFVYLRQPSDLSDPRNDPFWEFGSFGRTGCHSRNLLHPQNSPIKNGDRLAFLQGGKGEIRVVALTPPVTLEKTESTIEIRWDESYSPLPFEEAPLLVDNKGQTSFPSFMDILLRTNRSTFCGAAGSRLRGRTKALDAELANEILRWFENGDLPAASNYLHVIEAPDGRWHRHASAAGWSDHNQRIARFESLRHLSGVPASKEKTNKLKACADSKAKRTSLMPSDLSRKRRCR